MRICVLAICAALSVSLAPLVQAEEFSASGTATGFSASGEIYADRLSVAPTSAWKGNAEC